MMERKLIDLKGFKQLDGDTGGIEGYASPFGQLDAGKDIVLPGAYKNTIPDLLRDGWLAPDHAWGVKDDLGIFETAIEDDYGLSITATYHQTPDAQQVRAKVRNRLDNGKSAKLSIGYEVVASEKVTGEEAAAYLINATPEEIAYCKAQPSVRLLKEIKLYEVSLVSVPAAMGADVVEAKSKQSTETKGQYIGDGIEESLTMQAFEQLTNRLILRALWHVVYNSEGVALEDRLSVISASIDELQAYMLRLARALLTTADETKLAEAKSNIIAIIGDPSIDTTTLETKSIASPSLAERTLADHSEALLADVKGFTTRIHAIRTLRMKAGRVLNDAIRSRIKSHADAILSAGTDLAALYDETEPAAPAAALDIVEDGKGLVPVEIANGAYAEYLSITNNAT